VNVDEPVVRGNLPTTAIRTSPIGYVRFHGRNRRDWWPRIPRRRADRLRAQIAAEAATLEERRTHERGLAEALELQKAQRYNYLYTQTEFEGWRDRIRQVNDGAAVTYLITNNHYLGQAVANAKMLQMTFASLVAGESPPAIRELISTGQADERGGPRPDARWDRLLSELKG
jgi:uncharacterized protein YecE (DUF72 family)